MDLAEKAWTPIGDVTRSGSNVEGTACHGTLDGGNVTISNLFGAVMGTVKNVATSDSKIENTADRCD